MYQIGDQVIYGIHGVCNVADLEEKQLDGRCVTYLVLEPVSKDGSRYLLPTHNAAAMGKIRRILSKEALTELLSSEMVRSSRWIPDENQRKQGYRDLIVGGDPVRLLQMVHMLYRHRSAQTSAGRKIHLCDENFLRDAERLLAGEISIVMNMDQEQAKQYLRSKLKEDA